MPLSMFRMISAQCNILLKLAGNPEEWERKTVCKVVRGNVCSPRELQAHRRRSGLVGSEQRKRAAFKNDGAKMRIIVGWCLEDDWVFWLDEVCHQLGWLVGTFCLKNTVFNQEKGKGIIIQFHISRHSQPLLVKRKETSNVTWMAIFINRLL